MSSALESVGLAFGVHPWIVDDLPYPVQCYIQMDAVSRCAFLDTADLISMMVAFMCQLVWNSVQIFG